MVQTQLSPVYDDFLDFLVEKATPQELIAYRPSDEAQGRAVYLTERNKAGHLTDDESVELAQMMEFDLLVSALKARAFKSLKSK